MPSPAVDQPQPPGASQHAWPSDRDLATLREDVAAFAELGVPADPRDVRVAVAPYRVCPLGAHVDHQGGRVAGGARLRRAPRVPPSARAENGCRPRRSASNRNRNRTRSRRVGGAPALGRVCRRGRPLRRYASRRRHPWGVCGGGRDRRERHGDIEVREREGSWEKLGKVRAWRRVGSRRRRAAAAAPPARGVVGVARSFPPGARMDGGGLSSSAAITVACVMALQRVNERTEVAPARLKEGRAGAFRDGRGALARRASGAARGERTRRRAVRRAGPGVYRAGRARRADAHRLRRGDARANQARRRSRREVRVRRRAVSPRTENRRSKSCSRFPGCGKR